MTNDELRNTKEESSPEPYLVSRISYFSEPLARHLRAAAARRERQEAAEDRGWLAQITNYELRITNEESRSPARLLPFSPAPDTNEESALNSSLVTRHSSLVTVFPDIALAMLRTKTAAAGRVWLLLRHFDAAGRGRVAAEDAARWLTGDEPATRICGRRQWGNLLRAGDGLFWERDTGRDGAEWLRLRSAVRVAAALGVRRMSGSPVAVPLASLTGTIGQARAHLYAAFHSGRTRTDLLTGERQARGPISRASLCKLSGAAANSQRNYERRARVGRRSAIAVGPPANAADEQETAWRRGRSLFRLRDDKGRYGRPGAVYLAWQLPNEYTGPHDTLSRGRMKRLNRALADLFHDGITGNGGRSITNEEAAGGGRRQVADGKAQVARGDERTGFPCSPAPLLPCPPAPPRRFYSTAKAAHGARHGGERYWRYRDAWLWQPEIRDTRYEIRPNITNRRPSTQHGLPAAPSRSNVPLSHCPADLLDTGHLPLATCHLPPRPEARS